ncbi:MAG: class A beta-lactamase-related serine hydrolase [Verrucomicrobia bacterium]|nr:MAG: class A beta-lactamase-related serine hydrolase [Verrucomicrobiota bacterium]
MTVSPSALGMVMAAFEENFSHRAEIGASVNIWCNGQEILCLAKGWTDRHHSKRWTQHTLVPVYSATKPLAAACLLMALEMHGLDETTAVCEVWPQFPNKKARFAELLSHQCGLAALDQKADVFLHDEVVAAIEAQAPAWELGAGHGYHPRSFGALVEEPLRRLTGIKLGDFWRKNLADPLELDFWIGLPEEQWPRVAKLQPARMDPNAPTCRFYQERQKAESYTRRAFQSPQGLNAIQDMNDPMPWAAGLPAMGGIGTARSLAKFYQAAIGALPSPLSVNVRRAIATTQIDGDDLVLLEKTAFTCGAQKDPLSASGEKLRELYGPSHDAFGHPGAGGGHAFGDPEHGISFAYTMNHMQLTVMPGVKCHSMVEALYS